jgi:hypothetical protein
LEGVLDQALVSFGQESCEPNGSVVIDASPREFMLRPVSVAWASDETAFDGWVQALRDGSAESDIPADALSLIVVASTPFLKTASLVYEVPLSDLDSLTRTTVLTEPARPTPLSAPFNGFAIDLYLALGHTLDPRPLRPHLAGTWLSHSRYRFETSLAPALLPPTPLTEERRTKLGLLGRTVRYLQFGEHDLLEPYREQEQPVFYVDEELLGQLNARRTSLASKALQLQLATDFVSAVVRRAATEGERLKEVSYNDLSSSLLGSVIRLAAGAGATDDDRNRLLDRVADDPEFVIAWAEHFIGVSVGFTGVLADGGS